MRDLCGSDRPANMPPVARTSTPSPDPPPPGNGDHVVLLALIVIGLLVRATRINESLWYDEIAAWRDYASRGPAWILTTYDDPANHVAHSLLVWCSMACFGDVLGAEAGMRLPALVLSLLAIPALFSLGRRAGGARVGLFAATLAALAPVAVLEAADARAYSMMIFFAAAATAQLLAAVAARRIAPWAIYAVLAALGVWAHMMTVFLVVGHALWLAGRALRGGPWRAGAAGIAGAAALTLILYAPILDDIVRVRARFAGAESRGPSPFGAEGLHMLWQLGGAWAWWAALPGLLLAGVGFARALRDGPARAVCAAALVGLPALCAVVLLTGTWSYARFALFSLPGALVLIALGLDTLARPRALGYAALALLAGVWAGDLVTRPPRQPLRDAARYVEMRQAPDDRVLVVGLRHAVMEVYAGGLDERFSLQHGADLAAQLDEREPAWVIVMYPNSVTRDRYDLLEHRGYAPVARFDGWIDWTNGDLVVWRRGTESAP